jgi:hypothetical protein
MPTPPVELMAERIIEPDLVLLGMEQGTRVSLSRANLILSKDSEIAICLDRQAMFQPSIPYKTFHR